MDKAAECIMSGHDLEIVTIANRMAELAENLEGRPSPMWVFDIHTLAFLAVNDAAIQQYGYSRAQFLSMTILDIRPSEDIVPLLREEFLDGKHDSDLELWRHRKKDGSVIEVKITSREVIFNRLQAEIVIVREVNSQ